MARESDKHGEQRDALLRAAENLLQRCLRHGLLRSEAEAMICHIQAEFAAPSHEAPRGPEACKHGIRWPHECGEYEQELSQRLVAPSSIAASVADRPRGAYAPFTVREIDLIRAVLDDGTYTAQEKQDIGKLCDMAINCLLYGEEIRRLRGAPPSAIAAPQWQEAPRWSDGFLSLEDSQGYAIVEIFGRKGVRYWDRKLEKWFKLDLPQEMSVTPDGTTEGK